MKKIFFLIFLLASFIDNVYGQNIEMLERKNGFRGIKLGTNVNSYPFFRLMNKSDERIRVTDSFLGNIVRDEYLLVNRDNYYCRNCKSYLMISETEGYTKFTGADILSLKIETYMDTIYDIQIMFKQTGFSQNRYTKWKLCEAYGYPKYGSGWDEDLKIRFDNSGFTQMQWSGKNISLIYTSLNGSKYWSGSKRIAAIASYSGIDLSQKARLENEKNEPKSPPAIDDF